MKTTYVTWVFLFVSYLAPFANAWEPATHAGLSEQSALKIQFHKTLQTQLGLPLGWYTPLTVPPDQAPELFRILNQLNPAHGYAPNSTGTMTAGAWLMAGSAIANSPGQYGTHHFLDPRSQQGLTVKTLSEKAKRRFFSFIKKADLRKGKPVTEWIIDKTNPYSLQAFQTQYRLSLTAPNIEERKKHSALTLLIAGALLHALQDMGLPEHVRNDAAAFMEKTSPLQNQLGSRLARIASVLFGRIGVPMTGPIHQEKSFLHFFSNDQQTGLADKTERRWFSPGTLPKPMRIRPSDTRDVIAAKLAATTKRPAPAPLLSQDAVLDAQLEPGPWLQLENQYGTCLAEFKARDFVLSWRMSDRCLAQQAKSLLPAIGGYGAGLLEWLFRGRLDVRLKNGRLLVSTGPTSLGPGIITIVSSKNSTLTSLGTHKIRGAASSSVIPLGVNLPTDTSIQFIFDGVDGVDGSPLLAVGRLTPTGQE